MKSMRESSHRKTIQKSSLLVFSLRLILLHLKEPVRDRSDCLTLMRFPCQVNLTIRKSHFLVDVNMKCADQTAEQELKWHNASMPSQPSATFHNLYFAGSGRNASNARRDRPNFRDMELNATTGGK